MTDVYSTVPMVNTQITHLGFRRKDGKTDLVVGFRCFGPMTDNTKVEFMLGEQEPPTVKIIDYWEPTIRNTQGFEQHSQFGSVPFKWPDQFEPCDGPYINGEHLDNLDAKTLFLAFCTVDWLLDHFTIMAITTLE